MDQMCIRDRVSRASVLVVIAVAGKAERPAAVQAVVAALVFVKGVERGRRHRGRDGLRGDFLLGGLHARGESMDLRLIRLERDGRVGLLKAGRCV